METMSLQKNYMGFHPGNYLFPYGFPRRKTPYATVYMLPSHGNLGQLVGLLMITRKCPLSIGGPYIDDLPW